MNALKIIAILILMAVVTVSAKEKHEKISLQDLQETTHNYEPEAGASMLIQDVNVNLVYDNSKKEWVTEISVYHRIKIYDKSEIDKANFVIRYYDHMNRSEDVIGIKGTTYNDVNGKIVKTSLNKKSVYDERTSKYYSQKKIAMPDVREGSIVELKYKLKSPLLRIPQRYVQFDVPCNKAIYRVEVPEYFRYNSSSTGSVPMDVINDEGGDRIIFSYTTRTGGQALKSKIHTETINYQTTIQTFKAENIPSFKDEAFVRNSDNYRGSIKYELASYRSPSGGVENFLKSWDRVAQDLNASNDFGKFLTTKKKELYPLIEEVVSMSDDEKIHQVYSYIQKNYTWNGYYGVMADSGLKNLVNDNKGNVADINLLLVKMLRMAGLKSHPVVGRASSSGFLNVYYPTTDELDYVLAGVVRDDNSVLMIDATSKYHYLGSLPERALNLTGVLITDDDRGIQVSIKNPNVGKTVKLLKAHFDELEGLVVNCQTKTSKYDAIKMYLEKNSYASEEEWIGHLESEYPDIEVENTEVKYAESIVKGGTISQDYLDEVNAEEIGGKLYIDASFGLGTRTHPFKSNSREFPVFFESAKTNQYIIQFEVPEGYTVESYPETLTISLPERSMSYSYKVLSQDDELVVQINESRKKDIFA